MAFLPEIFSALLLLTIFRCYTTQSNTNTTTAEIYCYSMDNNKPQRKHYALQTPHPKDYTEIFDIPGCNPAKIWVVSRHGTRFPSSKTLKELAQSLPDVLDKVTQNKFLCKSDYELIKSWKMNEFVPPCSLTNPQGVDDLKNLAKSFKKSYPNLFKRKFSPKHYKFMHSSAQRTKQSCAAFTKELFGASGSLHSSLHWITDNLMLRPWLNCPLFQKNKDNLEKSDSQSNLFKNTTHYNNLLDNVSHRLGLKNVLSDQLVNELWDECRYQETYNLKKLSPWCAAFDIDEAKVLEYSSDLSYYYKFSYGNPLNQRLPCDSIKDMIQHMSDDKSANKVVVYFSHAELLLMIISALGAYHDAEPLLYNNYETMANRQFRTSILAPYASNIAAVRYDCPNTNGSKIVMLLNEKPFVMPWCKDGSVCTIEEMENYFNNSTMKHCPYGICGQEFASRSKASTDEMEKSC